MFKSYKVLGSLYNESEKIFEYHYIIIDSDFEEISIANLSCSTNSFSEGITVATANIYKKHNLNVGQNMALLCISLSEKWLTEIQIESIIQDEHCKKHIHDWNEIKKERDKYLEKYLLLI